MPTTCEILFDNYALGAIYAGELFRGTAQLTFTSPKCVRGIYIQFCGEAFAEWTPNTKKTAVAAQHVHLNERKCFVSGSNNGDGGVCFRIIPFASSFHVNCCF